MSVINITEENFENEVIKSEVPVMLDFYADFKCHVCGAPKGKFIPKE